MCQWFYIRLKEKRAGSLLSKIKVAQLLAQMSTFQVYHVKKKKKNMVWVLANCSKTPLLLKWL